MLREPLFVNHLACVAQHQCVGCERLHYLYGALGLQAGASNSTDACNMNELRQWNEQYGGFLHSLVLCAERARACDFQHTWQYIVASVMCNILLYVQVRVAAAGPWSLLISCKLERGHRRFGDFRLCCCSGLFAVRVLRVAGRRSEPVRQSYSFRLCTTCRQAVATVHLTSCCCAEFMHILGIKSCE